MEGLDFGHFNAIVVTGTTSASADTALTTLTVNPFSRSDVWALVLSGAGVYIEDANVSGIYQDGVLAATIDVRSTLTSEPFKILVIPCPVRPRTASG